MHVGNLTARATEADQAKLDPKSSSLGKSGAFGFFRFLGTDPFTCFEGIRSIAVSCGQRWPREAEQTFSKLSGTHGFDPQECAAETFNVAESSFGRDGFDREIGFAQKSARLIDASAEKKLVRSKPRPLLESCAERAVAHGNRAGESREVNVGRWLVSPRLDQGFDRAIQHAGRIGFPVQFPNESFELQLGFVDRNATPRHERTADFVMRPEKSFRPGQGEGVVGMGEPAAPPPILGTESGKARVVFFPCCPRVRAIAVADTGPNEERGRGHKALRAGLVRPEETTSGQDQGTTLESKRGIHVVLLFKEKAHGLDVKTLERARKTGLHSIPHGRLIWHYG